MGLNALTGVVLVAALCSGCGGSTAVHRPHPLPSAASPARAGAPETGAPETGAPETGAPETGAPARGAPARGAPETGAPARGVPAKPAPMSTPETMLLGRSEDGRRIFMWRVGDRSGPRVLVFGCIHGNETAGIAIARALERVHTADDLWIVPVLNPDGVALRTRQDARGVDLNANWSSQWRAGGRPWDVYDGGPRAFSERETRLARELILRLRPRVTIWYHQHMDLVWAFGASTAAGRIYARLAGMRLYHHHWLSGTAANWQNHHMPGTAAITVELPAGRLSPQEVRRHVRAVLAVARLTPGPGSSPIAPGRSTS